MGPHRVTPDVTLTPPAIDGPCVDTTAVTEPALVIPPADEPAAEATAPEARRGASGPSAATVPRAEAPAAPAGDSPAATSADSPEALARIERALLSQRRRAAGIPDGEETPTVGLALSGGGIRSATFCLGLLRGLAQNNLLSRFDYLSTVSGGGYVGAVFGRLVCALGIDAAQERLKKSDSLTLGWLRRYGRYLAPKGSRDYGMAIATYLRSALAIHAELGLLAMLLGVLVVLPHLLHFRFGLFESYAWSGWGSVWWPLAAFWWLVFTPGALVSYWSLRDSSVERRRAREARQGRDPAQRSPVTLDFRDALTMLLVVALVVTIVLRQQLLVVPVLPIRTPAGNVVLTLVLAGIGLRGLGLLARLYAGERDPAAAFARQRNRLTLATRRHNKLFAAMLVLGLLDLVSWQLMTVIQQGSFWVFGGLGVSGVAVVLVRALSEPLQKLMTSSDSPNARLLPQLLNVLGIAAALLLVVAWLTLVQWLVFGNADEVPAVIGQFPSSEALAVVAGVLLAWIALTFRNRDMPNATSLHNFYRARLTRAYLGTGNAQRFGPGLDEAGAHDPDDLRTTVTEVVPGDDTELADYRPEQRGGPIHLVNVCLNQTRADRSGLYNADRKGMPMTVSARGLEVGAHEVRPLDGTRAGTLGRWIAISGAAASPGAGSYTTLGWALLLFLAGARLGHWFWPDETSGERDRPGWRRPLRALAHRLANEWRTSKFGLLHAEATAAFGGAQRPGWYLSDGGHFDNTGVHALLRRELDVIVLADCGADPRFEYADLENLVRKARIDHDADIEFYTGQAGNALFAQPDPKLSVLSPERLIDNKSERGVLLARICYHRSDAMRCRYGTLVVIKPNLHESLDSDVLAYARRNQDFPQQSTGDQFFDEAQWESYHRLGEDFGRALDEAWLKQLPGWTARCTAPQPATPLRAPQPLVTASAAADKPPFWRTNPKTTALGATLSLGALGALVVPAWQAMQSVSEERADAREEFAALVRKTRDEVPFWMATGSVRPAGTPEMRLSSDVIERIGRVYEGIRRQPRAAYSAGTAGLIVRSLQAECQVTRDRVSRHYREDCPPWLEPDNALCRAVCDPLPDYWEPSDAVMVRMDLDGFRSDRSEWPKFIIGQESAAAVDTVASVAAPHPPGTSAGRQAGAVAGSDTAAPVDIASAGDYAADRDLAASTATAAAATTPAAAASRPGRVPAGGAARGTEPRGGGAAASSVGVTTVLDRDVLAHAQAQAQQQVPNDLPRIRQTQQMQIPDIRQMRMPPVQQAQIAPGSGPGRVPRINAAAAGAPPVANAVVTVPAPAVPAALAQCVQGGVPVQLYPHIYDEADRKRITSVPWDAIGTKVRRQDIENVINAALSKGARAPSQWGTPTLVFHRFEGAPACTQALKDWLEATGLYAPGEIAVRELPRSLGSRRRTIEFWVPPWRMAKGA